MATYVNDLRLKEIGTGESSGTWGTETNVNLELIGEALGYATEGITTNADTHATTVADGSTDPGRAMYIKYTGTLDSACTITIGPNTMSRVHIIENATSGSQNIIIKQGSGAEITIPNGYVKVVYLDGAGSGAAVTEAFDNLSVGTNFRVGNGAAEDTAIVFDGNAQDFYVGLDDSADDFMIGLGSTVGTTPIISVTDNKDVAIPDGTLTITTGNNEAQLILKSTDADVNSGPQLALTRDSGSPADDDFTGLISFNADDDGGNETRFGLIRTQIKDASDGSEDGLLDIKTMVAGTERSRLVFEPTETVINQDSVDIDTRIESNGNANMIFVDAGNDAVSIGHGSTIAIAGERHELQVYDTNFSCISAATFRNGSDGANLTLAHSRSGTIGTQTILQDGDTMGGINFMGSDGTDMASYGARIFCEVDGTPGSNDMPGRLIFATTADGGTGSTERMKIDSAGEVTMTRADNGVNLTLKCTDTDANAGPNFKLERAVTGADDDQIGNIIWNARDDSGNGEDYGRIAGFIGDASNGTENGRLNFQVLMNGTSRDYLILNGGGSVVVNQDSQDVDFRVESDSNDHMLFVDSGNNHVGIGTSSRTHNGNTAQTFIVSGGSGGSSQPIAMIIDEDGSVEGGSCILELSFTDDDSFSNARMVQFRDSSATQGTIECSGGGSVAYNTTSDERLKEDIQDHTASEWDALKAIKVRDYKWKRSGKSDVGFIAQELNEHWPEAVYEGGDDVSQDPWSVDYGKLTPILTKALQEAMEKIENLEAEVAKLKGD